MIDQSTLAVSAIALALLSFVFKVARAEYRNARRERILAFIAREMGQ